MEKLSIMSHPKGKNNPVVGRKCSGSPIILPITCTFINQPQAPRTCASTSIFDAVDDG